MPLGALGMALARKLILTSKGIAMPIAPNTLNPRSPNSATIVDDALEAAQAASHREPAPGEPPLPEDPPVPGDPPDSPPSPQAVAPRE
ncbi:hypothetical protein BAU07_17115 [Bordetella flabilis]|uniref:Uncharacterized protein n=2 Tax=Bordetella flabilis TaxID=463014 RepID=A0A193GEX0_9BORD|nr:hypothetical protein BAU07_17115 [Bordetella flabilis]